jgi:hypothetical protein
MRAAVPFIFPDILAAPSYAWPMQLVIDKSAVFKLLNMASANASPI